jgi:hypothetical protein
VQDCGVTTGMQALCECCSPQCKQASVHTSCSPPALCWLQQSQHLQHRARVLQSSTSSKVDQALS